jgi:thiol-disulfide isomerase/thioredoxin
MHTNALQLFLAGLMVIAPAAALATADSMPPGVQWRAVAGEADAQKAFADAKAQNKPVFLYWGAVWCPPCNQVKSTIFTRRDFIEGSKQFLPVYLDGDSPGAQKLASRYKVRGYPTMILFKPDGREITRLPGEVDPQKYLQVLTLGVSGGRPVKDLMQQALGKSSGALRAQDWRMLGFYSWELDEQQIVSNKDELPAMLNKLAAACPAALADVQQRLQLKALVAAASASKKPELKDDQRQQRMTQVMQVLSDNTLARQNFDVIAPYAKSVTSYLAPAKSKDREQLAAVWAATLDRLAADATLSRSDRMDAVIARVALAQIDDEKAPLSDVLKQHVRTHAQRTDRETSDKYERQAVIPSVGYALTEAGLFDEAEALLKAELPKSVAAYYHMSGLSSNARKKGDKPAAVDWAEKAYVASQGPATRLQWGAAYVASVIDLAPQDAARVEKAVASVIGDIEVKPETFYERSQRSLERIGKKLQDWNKDGKNADAVQRLQQRLGEVCGKLPTKDPARGNCDAAFKPAKAAA